MLASAYLIGPGCLFYESIPNNQCGNNFAGKSVSIEKLVTEHVFSGQAMPMYVPVSMCSSVISSVYLTFSSSLGIVDIILYSSNLKVD